MDQIAVNRFAMLIVSLSKQKPQKLMMSILNGLPEVDPGVQALCNDIVGKVTANQKEIAIQKIGEALAQTNIEHSPEDSKKVYDAIYYLIKNPFV